MLGVIKIENSGLQKEDCLAEIQSGISSFSEVCSDCYSCAERAHIQLKTICILFNKTVFDVKEAIITLYC